MPRELANERMGAKTAAALALAAACASAQIAPPTLRPELAAAVVARLADADPVVRGEAALLAALDATPAIEAKLLALAKDDQPAARLRARIALGRCRREAALDALILHLDDGSHGDDDAIADAFGLGLAGFEGEAAIARVLIAAEHASWKRRRDVVLALLLGLRGDARPTATAALRRAYDDDSNRDPEVRALLLARLVAHDPSLDDKALRRALERDALPERLAALRGLAAANRPVTGDLLADVARLAGHAPEDEARAAALATLARVGSPQAHTLAAKAVRAGGPATAAEALRVLRQTDGAVALRAVAAQLLGERDPARAAALLAGFDAPPPAELRDRCAALAADAANPPALRAAAAMLLARAEPARGSPLALALFRRDAGPDALAGLAVALQRDPAGVPPTRATLPDGLDLARATSRWSALLAAHHGEALELAAKAIAGDPTVAPPLPALRALRAAFVLPEPTHPAAPAVLRALLTLAGDGR